MGEKFNDPLIYCHDPPGNVFNLLYDTEMLVMCYGDPILREWYSVDGNNTRISDLVKWYPEKQPFESHMPMINLLTNLTLYDRRKNLEGKVFRAVAVKVRMSMDYAQRLRWNYPTFDICSLLLSIEVIITQGRKQPVDGIF